MGKRRFFPQFHVHDDHSIKDGLATVETYADQVVDLKGEVLAVTNHGMATGFARQYFACRDRKIKPVFGMEAYVNDFRLRPIDRMRDELKKRDKATKKRVDANKQVQAKMLQLKQFVANHYRPSPHSVLLAKNREGYRNLVRMSTDSFRNGYYYVPRTDTEFLIEHAYGMVYSTACIGGYFTRVALTNFDLACAKAAKFKERFEANGGTFYVELMMTEYSKQREANEAMIKLASRIGAKCIITCDVHYHRPEDGVAQDCLLLMRDKKTMKDKFEGDGGAGVWQFEAKDLWWRTMEDVARCYRDHHSDYMDLECFREAVRNTLALADEIEDIEFDTSLKLPGVFPNPEQGLRELIKTGLRYRKERGQLAPGVKLKDYAERIHRELSVIEPKGFSEYFLILHDICDHARKIGSRMGPGRGSAGGSLIAYLCRITEIDPLRFNLLFERFLAADRDDPPDIDLDFSPEHRDGIKAYVEKRYPATATIGSNATFKPRATIQGVARVFDLDHREVLKVTKPMGLDADDMTWEQIADTWPQVQRFADDHPDAWAVIQNIRGLISHRGKNAAGMLIAPNNALDELPMMVEKDSKGNVSTVTAWADTQGDGVGYAGRELTRFGYLKADLLGVRNLNVAPMAAELVQRDTGQVIELESLPLDDGETLDTASESIVPGVFQLDTYTTRPIMKHVGVDAFADLVMITALARPGPLKHQVHKDFAKLKRDDNWKGDTPEKLIPLLQDSRGLMILQEDVMWVVNVLGGLSMQEANRLRKIMSKKHPEAMKLWKQRFLEGGAKVGISSEEDLAELWEKIATFAEYGFCKAHSVAYMITAYRQLYMLTHYPVEYFAALLTHTERGKKDSRGTEVFVDYLRAAMAARITVLGPCVNSGALLFDVDEESRIRFGLGHVKGVGKSATTVIELGPYESLEDFYDKIPRRTINKRVVLQLIYSGAMDSLDFDRHAGKEMIPDYPGLERRNALVARYFQIKGEKDEPDVYPETVLREKEREALGLPLSWWSSGEINEVRELEGLETIEYHKRNDLARVEVVAEISKAKVIKTRKGQQMAFLSVADETGQLDNLTIWPSEWSDYKRTLAQGKIVVLRLRRKPNRDRNYGKWCYHLDDKYGEPAQSIGRVIRFHRAEESEEE